MDQILGVKTHKLAKDTRTQENKRTREPSPKRMANRFQFPDKCNAIEGPAWK